MSMLYQQTKQAGNDAHQRSPSSTKTASINTQEQGFTSESLLLVVGMH
jgi:hypothetical protein